MGSVHIVAEESLVALLAADPPLHRVGRERARGRWRDITADAVLDALETAGPNAVVLARPGAADAGATAVPSLARTMGREVVRLPGERAAAAWIIALAVQASDADRAGLSRALQVLAGVGGRAHTHPNAWSIRPALLMRWARRAWRPCRRCVGGGMPGWPCGRCGERLTPAPARAATP